MIDNFAILVSTLTCMFIVFRAARLDRILPWYGEREAAAPEQDTPEAAWIPPWSDR